MKVTHQNEHPYIKEPDSERCEKRHIRGRKPMGHDRWVPWSVIFVVHNTARLKSPCMPLNTEGDNSFHAVITFSLADVSHGSWCCSACSGGAQHKRYAEHEVSFC